MATIVDYCAHYFSIHMHTKIIRLLSKHCFVYIAGIESMKLFD